LCDSKVERVQRVKEVHQIIRANETFVISTDFEITKKVPKGHNSNSSNVLKVLVPCMPYKFARIQCST